MTLPRRRSGLCSSFSLSSSSSLLHPLPPLAPSALQCPPSPPSPSRTPRLWDTLAECLGELALTGLGGTSGFAHLGEGQERQSELRVPSLAVSCRER